MASLEPLGLSFKSHHTGKDVSVAWEFFWILQHKKQNYNQYCFGIFKDNHRYEDKMRLDNRNMYRLTLTVPFLQRIFNNEVLRTANGVEKADKNTWLDKFAGQRGDTFFWKDPETGVISRTNSHVEIVDRDNWITGDVPYELEDMYFPKSGKKSKTSSSRDSAATALIDNQQKSTKKCMENCRVLSKEEKENREFVHRANVFSTVNVVFRRRGEKNLTFGKIPVDGDIPPTCIDWSVFETRQLSKHYIEEFNVASILVEGKKTKNGWNKELFSGDNESVYFFDRANINFTKLLEKEKEVDKATVVPDDEVDEWADDLDFSPFSEFNLCWRWKTRNSLIFGKVPVSHKNNLLEVPTREIKLVDIDELRLAELVDLPIVVDEKQGPKNWVTYLYEKKSPNFWYFNRHNGTITRTSTRCALRGGFTTRNLAASQGIEVSSIQEFNNVGTSLEYKSWPKERISGDKGFCAPIAAYYICSELSFSDVETLQKGYHQELSIMGNSCIFVTDGTYAIVDVINRKLSTTSLQQVYPAKNAPSTHGFNNDVFGDSYHVGKFLVELRDENITSPIGISHFVSLDTHKLEIYDPMSVRGAIVTQRNSEDNCLFLETLHLLHTVKVFTVWKLVNKLHRKSSESTPNEHVCVGEPKKKKRRGQKRKNLRYFC